MNSNFTKYLDVMQLKAAATAYKSRPYWFGLGFIQLKLNRDQRMHFWTPNIPRPEREEIHDHRYNFSSHVLAGVLQFELYEVSLSNRYPPGIRDVSHGLSASRRIYPSSISSSEFTRQRQI